MIQVQRFLPLAAALVLALGMSALAPEASACVSCQNLQCVAIIGPGAIDCSSGWFFGSYCNLAGDCRTSSSSTMTPKSRLALRETYALGRGTRPGPSPFEVSVRGLFGASREIWQPFGARRRAPSPRASS